MAIGKSRLNKLANKSRLISDLVAWYGFFDEGTKKEIIDWVQNDQLRKEGVAADGEVIGYYSFVTEIITRGRKQQGDKYNLFDTGEFYRSMFVLVLQDSIIVKGDGQKGNENLFEKYGSNIISLTDANKSRLRIKLKNYYVQYLRKILLGP
jgi:hypothetical protein